MSKPQTPLDLQTQHLVQEYMSCVELRYFLAPQAKTSECLNIELELCGCICLSIQDVQFGWLFLCGHSFFFFQSFGGAELEQEVRCIIHRSVSVRNERLRLTCLRWVGYGTQLWHNSWGHQRPCFVFVVISAQTCSRHLSMVQKWKFSHPNFSVWLLYDSVVCPSFLCSDTVW